MKGVDANIDIHEIGKGWMRYVKFLKEMIKLIVTDGTRVPLIFIRVGVTIIDVSRILRCLNVFQSTHILV